MCRWPAIPLSDFLIRAFIIAHSDRINVPRQTLLSYMFNRPRLAQMNHQLASEASAYSWDNAMTDLGIDTALQEFRIDTINTLDLAFGCGQRLVHRGCLDLYWTVQVLCTDWG